MSWCQTNRKRKRRSTRNLHVKVKRRRTSPSSIHHQPSAFEPQRTLPPAPSTLIKAAFMEGEEEEEGSRKVSRNTFCIDNDISIGGLRKFDDRSNPHKGFEYCSRCNQLLHVIPSESRLVCLTCAESSEHVLAISNNVRYGNDTSTVVHVYLREKNFLSWLKQYEEGQEVVPDDVLLQVKRALRTKHVKSSLEVKATPVAKLLKKLGLGRYAKKASRIAARLNRQPIPEFTSYEIDQFLAMFRAIQVPFMLIKGVNRRNFLSASYLVCKFAELRGWGHFRIPQNMLKSRPVLIGQDQDWALVSRHLDFPFYRSV